MSSNTSYAEGITAETLRTFLALWPLISNEAEDAQRMLIQDKDKLFGNETEFLAWCFLYELPIRQHVAAVNEGTLEGYTKIIQKEQVDAWYKQLVSTPGQIAALPGVLSQIDQHFDTQEVTKAEAQEMLSTLATCLGLSLSLYNSLRCVLYHGCFLNDLIERVRKQDDKALFEAIRIDPTVIGCPSVSARISKAMLLHGYPVLQKTQGSHQRQAGQA